MTEEECQDVDESMQDHAQRSRRNFEKGVRAPNTDFADHVEGNDFTSLLDHLDYPEQDNTKSSKATTSTKETPPRPMLRRNPSKVDTNDPMIEVLVILMRFQDHKNRTLPPKEAYSTLWNEQIQSWFDLNSYGNYRYHATVTDWMDTDDTEDAYAAGVSGLTYSLQEAIWPLLDRLNRDHLWDWSKFDHDNDGKLDAVVVLHSGYPAERGGRDCINQRPATHRIWSHAFASSETWTTIGVMGSPAYSANLMQYQQLQQQLQALMQQEQEQQQQQQFQGGQGAEAGMAPMSESMHSPLEAIYALHGYQIASGLSSTCGANVAKMGVLVHEYMHTLGLDDAYDYGMESNGKGIGIWDIMGYPYGPANDEDYPGHLSAYSKLSLGWITPVEWTPSNGTMDLSLVPAEISNQAIKIFLTNGTRLFDVGQPISAEEKPKDPLGVPTKMMPQYQRKDGYYEEYLLLEHRQPLEFDKDLKERAGLVIYHVDESVPRMTNGGYPGQEGWPQNGKHYRVSVLGADSLYHLERGINKGDRGDVWTPGSVLGPGTNPKAGLGKSSLTYPNTDAYQYGVIEETGIYVKPLTQTKGLVTLQLFWMEGLSPSPDVEVGRQSESEDWWRTANEHDPHCTNLWSWVDLKVVGENGNQGKKSMHCDEIAKDPNSFCGLSDVSSDLKVSEICRKECPDSECYL